MANSFCKVENGVVVDGPRAWPDATPPDNTWFPHTLEDPGNPDEATHCYSGSHHEVRGEAVVEVKEYRAYTAEELAEIARQVAERAAQEGQA